MSARVALLLALLDGGAARANLDRGEQVARAAENCRQSAAGAREELKRYNECKADPKMEKCWLRNSAGQDVTVGDAEKFIAAATDYSERLARVAPEIKQLELRIKADLNGMSQAGFAKDEEVFEEWARQGEEGRSLVLRSAMQGLLASLIQAKKSTIELTPKKAEKLIAKLKGLDVGDPYLFEGITKVAAIRGKAGKLKQAEEVARVFGMTKDLILMEHGDPSDALENLLTIAGWFYENPFVEGIKSNVEIAGLLAFELHMEPKLDEMLAITDEKLARLKPVKVTIEDAMKRRNALLAEVKEQLLACTK